MRPDDCFVVLVPQHIFATVAPLLEERLLDSPLTIDFEPYEGTKCEVRVPYDIEDMSPMGARTFEADVLALESVCREVMAEVEG